jgi:hypothetical protein
VEITRAKTSTKRTTTPESAKTLPLIGPRSIVSIITFNLSFADPLYLALGMPKQSFMRKRAARFRLDKFEKLIRDAIALLVKRGWVIHPTKDKASDDQKF